MSRTSTESATPLAVNLRDSAEVCGRLEALPATPAPHLPDARRRTPASPISFFC